MNDTIDFHLIVNKVHEGGPDYVTAVAEAPVERWGRPFGRMSGDFSDVELSLNNLISIRAPRGPDQALWIEWNEAATPGSMELASLGRALFRKLFPRGSAAYHLFGQSCQHAVSMDKMLRLKLEVHHELSSLPWEIIRPTLQEDLDVHINKVRYSIVRYLGDIRRTVGRRPEADAKPYVMVVMANPDDHKSPAATKSFSNEFQAIKTIFDQSDFAEMEAVNVGATTDGIRQAVTRIRANQGRLVGIHFIGHGWIDQHGSYFCGTRSDDKVQRIYGDDLLRCLDEVDGLDWIIFNACSTAAEPVGLPLAGLATAMSMFKDVPLVLAYKRPVDTNDAESLGRYFFSEMFALTPERRRSLTDTVRQLQQLYRESGGLVVLARSVEGRIWEPEGYQAPSAKPDPGTKAGAREQATGPGATRYSSDAPSASKPKTAPPPTNSPPPPRRTAVPSQLGEMVRVPKGSFNTGLTGPQIDRLLSAFREHQLATDPAILTSIRDALRETEPRDVVVDEFWLDVTPVTNRHFAAFVDAEGYRTTAEQNGAPQSWRMMATAGPDHPVVLVSYPDALAYCRWAGKRLPRVDEWRRAYRGSEGRIYPWGNDFAVARCNTAESGLWSTSPVTAFQQGRSEFGCLDMVGNVEEFTQIGPDGTIVLLGGSWCMTCEVYGLFVLHRLARESFYSEEQGFRCAADAPPQAAP